MINQDIINGAIFGHVIGDALGVPVEYSLRAKLDKHPVDRMLANGTHNMPQGTWSDDSSMMLCTLASIIEKQDVDSQDIMHRFSMWAKNGYMTPYGKPFGIGRTTLKSIGKYLRGEIVAKCGCLSEKDNGNGSLMRILPVSLFNCFNNNIGENEDLLRIHKISSLTHAHERSCVACGIYDFIFKEIVKLQNKSSIYLGLEKAANHYKHNPEFQSYKRLFEIGFCHLSKEEIKSSGYVVDTLEAAVWCLLNSENYRDTILKAVNLGGDTDTIAAVAGGIAGTLYGYDDLPKEWIDVIVNKDKIALMCNDFCNIICE